MDELILVCCAKGQQLHISLVPSAQRKGLGIKMTGQMTNCGGIPLLMPNDVTYQETDFYISYNDRDTSLYGDVTTALVLVKQGSLTKFLILNGNHTKAYKDIIASGCGYQACIEYFKSNLDKQNRFSENWDETTVLDSQGFLYVVKDVAD